MLKSQAGNGETFLQCHFLKVVRPYVSAERSICNGLRGR